MSIYTRFVSGFLFPAHEYLKRHETVEVARRLDESQWWDSGELARHREAKFQHFIRDITASVPYYKQLFDKAEINADSADDTTVLARLPFLTKDIIRNNSELLRATNCGPLTRMNTGGSTGEPVVFQVGNERISHDVAAKWRATRWWDVDVGDLEYVIWGSPIEVGKQDKIKILRDRVMRTQLFSAFAMSNDWMEDLLQRIAQKPPKMLFGYPSALAKIALAAEDTGASYSDLGIKVAFVTAEKCYDHQKAAIERVFGCPVANGYGGRDSGFIAHECPSGSLHISAEDIIVEIVGEDGCAVPIGERGEIVVTHLATRDFPFVRYRTGDVGALSDRKCDCGRTLPILKEVSGRSTDFIQAVDGTLMHGLALIYILRDLEGIKSFKIIQESAVLIRLLLVPNANFSTALKDTIVAGFRDRLGQDMNVRIECVDNIPAEASGKFRYVVNKMDSYARNVEGMAGLSDA